MMIKNKRKALVLFSGGLDSILAVKILEKQGIRVTALTFVSYFFDAEEAKKSAKKNKIKIEICDIAKSHFGIVKKPRFGRGAGMNPCIDCHLLMLKFAKKFAKKEGYDIIATGEVLGQRPMSQNRRALELIEKQAGLAGKILRPLSAKVLPETEMEALGLVERKKMLSISGRGRKEQMAHAKKYNIKYFPTPAGGCILTDKEYSKKLGVLFENNKKPAPNDIQLLKIGRHFWSEKTKIVLGRNHEENDIILDLRDKKDLVLGLKSNLGPLALLRGPKTKKALDFAREKILFYGRKKLEEGGKSIIHY